MSSHSLPSHHSSSNTVNHAPGPAPAPATVTGGSVDDNGIGDDDDSNGAGNTLQQNILQHEHNHQVQSETRPLITRANMRDRDRKSAANDDDDDDDISASSSTRSGYAMATESHDKQSQSDPDDMSSSTLPHHHHTKQTHWFGLFLVMLVVFLWVGSSSLIQVIYDEHFDKPFFVTYLSTSLFMFYLACAGCRRAWNAYSSENGSVASALREASQLVTEPLKAVLPGTTAQEPAASTATPTHATGSNANSHSGTATMPILQGSGNHSYYSDGWMHTPELSSIGTAAAQNLPSEEEASPIRKFTLRETAFIAMWLCPLWFALNYTYNLSLSRTSIASTTILSATSGLWTMLLAIWILKDKWNIKNVFGVVATILGAVLVSVSDTDDNDGDDSSSDTQHHTFLGAMFALLSAVFYSCYTIAIDYKIRDENAIDMQVLFGLIGFFNFIGLWPLFFILNWMGVESLEMPSGRVMMFLAINGMFGSVLSDYLWARSVLLTTPLIATLGLSMTIPVAMIVDLVWHHTHYGVWYIVGSLAVVSGFVLVNMKHHAEVKDEGEEDRSYSSDSDYSDSDSGTFHHTTAPHVRLNLSLQQHDVGDANQYNR
jgi:solute carrier family 35, member F5